MLYAYCTCKAGAAGADGHTQALLRELAEYSTEEYKEVPSETAVTKLCSWNIRKSADIEKVSSMDMVFTKLSKKKVDELNKTTSAAKKENRGITCSGCSLYEACKEKSVDAGEYKAQLKSLSTGVPFSYMPRFLTCRSKVHSL